MRPVTRLSAALLAALLGGACASAEKRMSQGLTLEQRGRPAEAAERYIDALKKDPSLASARARLGETGRLALEDAVRQADALDRSGRSAEAADLILRMDALRGDAAAVGVELLAPADYAQRRRATFDRAIDASMDAATRVGGNGFDAAVRGLERAASRWEPNADQRGRLDRARFDTHLAWAEEAMRRGSFRAAYERAGAAAAVFGREGGEAGRARGVQDEALRRGTVRVAVLPVAAEGAARARGPEDLLPALNDELEINRWSRAPLFLAVMDPREVRAAARRHGYQRPTGTLRDAELFGRRLGVDLVVIPVLDSVVVTDAGVRETRRTARTTAGVDTAYTLREGRRTVRARVAYTVLNVRDGRRVDDDEVWGTGDADFREARFAGSWRDLDLPRRERDLFDDRRDRMERTTVEELTRQLASRLEGEVFDRLLREVR